jgi:hypothetical protein
MYISEIVSYNIYIRIYKYKIYDDNDLFNGRRLHYLKMGLR